MGAPDCINALWKRLPVSPPLVNICKETEIAPALSPQLPAISVPGKFDKRGYIYLHGDAVRIATKSCDVFLNPSKSDAFCGESLSDVTRAATIREDLRSSNPILPTPAAFTS